TASSKRSCADAREIPIGQLIVDFRGLDKCGELACGSENVALSSHESSRADLVMRAWMRVSSCAPGPSIWRCAMRVRFVTRALRVLLGCVLALVVRVAPASAATLDVNLLVNGDAEAGTGISSSDQTTPIPGWQITSTPVAIKYGAAGGFP